MVLGRPSSSWAAQTVSKSDLIERPDGRSLVILHVKDGVELGDLEEVVHFLGQVQQLQFAALVAYRGKCAYQLANA